MLGTFKRLLVRIISPDFRRKFGTKSQEVQINLLHKTLLLQFMVKSPLL